jgi:hypothetical protein
MHGKAANPQLGPDFSTAASRRPARRADQIIKFESGFF